ncbi:MAG TPA: Bax inhibitor-1/YccA family protein [Candidatus Limnocylindria bacterium]
MKELLPRRSANPAFNDKTFDGLTTTSGEAMTLDGTVNRAFALVFILMAGAFVSMWAGPGYWLIGAVAGLVLSLVTVFRKAWAPVTAPLYAFAEGLFVGGISVLLETAFPGIVIPAVSLTVAIFIAFLVIYRTHLIRVTDKLRIAVFAATGAVALVYLASLVLNVIGVQVAYLNEAVAGSGALGIAVNVIVIGIAAFNLLLDFDLVERGVAARAPKYMEWYGAFALLVTLVWLYIELLRLLSRLRSR